MKFFHTADWHLGKIVQGVSMTGDQEFILEQFIADVAKEQPDAVIIAGDIYDRSIPPTEAVQLLNRTFEEIILSLKTPILAIAGNHDSASRLQFGSTIMQENGLHLAGQFDLHRPPVVLEDAFGEVHFHLVPFYEPSIVRTLLKDETIRTYNDATEKIVAHLKKSLAKEARHVFIGHSFVTPYGEAAENTSDSEKPLSIGGVEYVSAHHFEPFHYTALGHLHRAHFVAKKNLRYAGSPLKYSISEENHQKGYYVVELDETGAASVEKRSLTPRRDLYSIKATLEELTTHEGTEDYVFVTLMDETPVLSPMEKVRSIYPNALHVERANLRSLARNEEQVTKKQRSEWSDLQLFQAFYKEITGNDPSDKEEKIFIDVVDEQLKQEREA